jgi:hypothetical protein
MLAYVARLTRQTICSRQHVMRSLAADFHVYVYDASKATDLARQRGTWAKRNTIVGM